MHQFAPSNTHPVARNGRASLLAANLRTMSLHIAPSWSEQSLPASPFTRLQAAEVGIDDDALKRMVSGAPLDE